MRSSKRFLKKKLLILFVGVAHVVDLRFHNGLLALVENLASSAVEISGFYLHLLSTPTQHTLLPRYLYLQGFVEL